MADIVGNDAGELRDLTVYSDGSQVFSWQDAAPAGAHGCNDKAQHFVAGMAALWLEWQALTGIALEAADLDAFGRKLGRPS